MHVGVRLPLRPVPPARQSAKTDRNVRLCLVENAYWTVVSHKVGIPVGAGGAPFSRPASSRYAATCLGIPESESWVWGRS